MRAYCWASGLIEFGQRVPNGALPIAYGPAKRVRSVVLAWARDARDGKRLLVPGVPEAADELAAVDAVAAFRDQVQRRVDDQQWRVDL